MSETRTFAQDRRMSIDPQDQGTHQRSKPEQMGESGRPNYWAIPMPSSIEGH